MVLKNTGRLDICETDAKENNFSPFARGKRLKMLRKIADLTRNQVEEKYHISVNTQRSWEEGKHTGLTEQGARRILVAFRNEGVQASIGWLLHGTGSAPRLTEKLFDTDMLPFEEIKKENAADFENNEKIFSELEFFFKMNGNAISLQINDDSMEPFILAGDYVAGISRFGDSISQLIGKNCIIETEMGEKYVRLLRKGSKPGLYTIACLNPHTTIENPIIYDIELTSAAPIIWQRRNEVI